MSDRLSNPFQTFDILVPEEHHKEYKNYLRRGSDAITDQHPFPRMVDMWFLAVCIAVRLELPPEKFDIKKSTKIIDGSIFSSDPWRIHVLMLIAISYTGDDQIVLEEAKILRLANQFAVAGFPKLVKILTDGDSAPIWNISDEISNILQDSTQAATG